MRSSPRSRTARLRSRQPSATIPLGERDRVMGVLVMMFRSLAVAALTLAGSGVACAQSVYLYVARRLGVCDAHPKRPVLQRGAHGLSGTLSWAVCAAGAGRRRAAFAGLSRRGRAGGLRDTCAHLYAGVSRAPVGLWRGARRRRAAPRLCRGAAAAAGLGAISPVAGVVGRLDALVPHSCPAGIERACSSAGPDD